MSRNSSSVLLQEYENRKNYLLSFSPSLVIGSIKFFFALTWEEVIRMLRPYVSRMQLLKNGGKFGFAQTQLQREEGRRKKKTEKEKNILLNKGKKKKSLLTLLPRSLIVRAIESDTIRFSVSPHRCISVKNTFTKENDILLILRCNSSKRK